MSAAVCCGVRAAAAARLHDVEELERLHLKAEVAVHHEQHEVRKLGGVNLRQAREQAMPAAAAGVLRARAHTMLLRSGPHSTSCRRRCLPDTTVTGPLTEFRLCRV